MPQSGSLTRASDIPVRAGVRLRRAANQSINSGAATSISWDTEDEDLGGYWTSGTTITVPAGYAGIHVITFHALCSGITGTGGAVIIDPTSSITGLPADWLMPLDETRDRGSITVITPLADGDTFVCQGFHLTGSAVNFTAWMACYRTGA